MSENKKISKEKLDDLRQRMIHHTTVNGVAVVILTARELQELLDAVREE